MLIKSEGKNKSLDIIEYSKNKFKDFFQEPINEVDALILAQLTYFDFQGIVGGLEEKKEWRSVASLYKAENFSFMTSKIIQSEFNLELFAALCASPRYRDIIVNFYVEKHSVDEEEQFAAITFKLPTGEIVVAYRGTDTTMIGWKEDFNMTFLSPVPSQLSAADYLQQVADKTSENIYIVGHSKGGNLAVYGAAHSATSIQDRINAIYNFDGPGFSKEFLESDDYGYVGNKIIKFIPEGSIVGMLLENSGNINFVQSSGLGVLQHIAFSWKIANDKFQKTENNSGIAKKIDRDIDAWVSELDLHDRKIFIDTVFSIISSANINTLYDFTKLGLKETEVIYKAIKELKEKDEKTYFGVKEIFDKFLRISLTSKFEKSISEKTSAIEKEGSHIVGNLLEWLKKN